jgi:outer membrane protein TolC
LNDLRSARITLKASKAQVKAEKKKYQAEMERYQKGRVPTSAVIQFEGDLRAAQLREAIQCVSLGLTESKLALAMGELPELLEQAQGDAQ